jgi:hypothetical protein
VNYLAALRTPLAAAVRRGRRALTGSRGARALSAHLARHGAVALAWKRAARWLGVLAAVRPRLVPHEGASPWDGALARVLDAGPPSGEPAPPRRRSTARPSPGAGRRPERPSPAIPRREPGAAHSISTAEPRRRATLPTPGAPTAAQAGTVRAVLDRLAGPGAGPGAAVSGRAGTGRRSRVPSPAVTRDAGSGATGSVAAGPSGGGESAIPRTVRGWRERVARRVLRRLEAAPPFRSSGSPAPGVSERSAPEAAAPPLEAVGDRLWLVPVGAGTVAPPELLRPAALAGRADRPPHGSAPRAGALPSASNLAVTGPGGSLSGRSGRGSFPPASREPGSSTQADAAGDPLAPGPQTRSAPFRLEDALDGPAARPARERAAEAPAPSPLRLPVDGRPAELDPDLLARSLERLLGDEARRHGLDV